MRAQQQLERAALQKPWRRAEARGSERRGHPSGEIHPACVDAIGQRGGERHGGHVAGEEHPADDAGLELESRHASRSSGSSAA